MKINSVSGCSYNIKSNKSNSVSSKPTFKGIKFANTLKKEYQTSGILGKSEFDIFKGLMQRISEEIGFEVKNKEVFNNLLAIKNEDDLISVLTDLHQNNQQSCVIAKDSKGPLLEFINLNSVKHSMSICELQFSSTDKSGCKQSVSFKTAGFFDEIVRFFEDSNGHSNNYQWSKVKD